MGVECVCFREWSLCPWCLPKTKIGWLLWWSTIMDDQGSNRTTFQAESRYYFIKYGNLLFSFSMYNSCTGWLTGEEAPSAVRLWLLMGDSCSSLWYLVSPDNYIISCFNIYPSHHSLSIWYFGALIFGSCGSSKAHTCMRTYRYLCVRAPIFLKYLVAFREH